MSKLFKRVSGITLGLALCFGFSFSCSNKSSGQMTRATPGDEHALFDVSSGWGSDGKSYTTYSSTAWTSNGCQFAYAANNNKQWNSVRLGGKQIEGVNAYLGTTSPTDFNTSSVVITVDAIYSTSQINSVMLKVWNTYSSSSWSGLVDEITLTSEYAVGEVIAQPTSGTYWNSGVYFQLVVNYTNTTKSNRGTDISKLIAVEAASSGVTLSEINVTNAPAKTKYVPSESFDATGMVITATYSDNSTATVNLNDCTFNPSVIVENCNVTITYNEQTTTQAVTVYSVQSVESVADGYPTEVRVGSNSLSCEDLFVNVLCDDSVTRTVHPTSIEYDFSTVGTATVTCTYSYASGTKTATFDVNVNNPGDGTAEHPYTVSEAYEIVSQLGSGEYYGQPVYIKGIVSSENSQISVGSNHRGQFNISDENHTLFAYNLNKCTKTNEDGYNQIEKYYEVVVCGDLENYNGTYEIVYNSAAENKKGDVISSSAPVLVSIEANVLNGDYYTGSKLTASAFSVTANYSNGKPSGYVTDGFSWTVNGVEDGTLSEGNNSVKVFYGNKESSVLTVAAQTVHALDIAMVDGTKTVYIGTPVTLQTIVDPDGALDTISWSSSDTDVATVDSDGKVTGVSEGETTITASITNSNGTFLDECIVTVVADYVTSMSWTNTSASQFGPFYSTSNAQLTTSITDTWNVSATWAGKGTVNNLKFGDYTLKIGEKSVNSLPYTYAVEDDGQQIKIVYGVDDSGNSFEKINGTAKASIVKGLNNIEVIASGSLTINNAIATAEITNEGVNGGSGGAASATQNGITFSSDGGYFEGNQWKIYNGKKLIIQSTLTIESLELTFSSTSYNGLNSSYEVNSASFEATASKQTRITSLKVVYDGGNQAVYYNNQVGHEAAQRKVVEFATYLNETMGVDGICGTSIDNYGIHDSNDFAYAWLEVYAKYDELFGSSSNLSSSELEFAKTMLANATATWDASADELQRAMQTYDFVIENYSNELIAAGMDTPNFMVEANGSTPLRSLSHTTKPVGVVLNSNDTSLIIIFAICSLGVGALSAYYLVKKRKRAQ